MRFVGRLSALITCMLWTCVALAQYPVTTTITLIPPHTNQLSALHSATSNKMMVTVLLNDDEEPSYQAKLRFKILGDGYTIETKSDYFPSPIVLDYNIPLVLQGFELAEYFQPSNLIFQGLDQQQFLQTGRLPEGPFSICVEVYDYIRDFQLPVSNEACAYAYVEEHDPPVIITPIGIQQVHEPFTLEFTWQPMHIGGFPAQYNLFVFEKIPGLSADQILQSTAPVFTISTMALTHLHTAVDPPLDLDQPYLVVVQLEDLNGEAAIKNDGFSEVEEFILLTQECTAGGPCDDNDPCTINDVYSGNCVCEGTPADDSDNDTVCDPEDQCPGEDDIVDANQNGVPDCLETDGGNCITGSPCDDNNPCTENDTIDLNCDCMGTPIMDCDFNACILDWTPIPYECGSNNGNIDVDALPLINYLEPDDTIIASDFLVVLKNVTINSDGTFTGIGYIAPEFFNQARINLEFENIKVDQGCRMVEGMMGVTGAGIQVISDSTAAIIQEVVEILSEIDTILSTVEEVMEVLNPIITTTTEIDEYFTDGWTSATGGTSIITDEYPYINPAVVEGLDEAIECIKSNPGNYVECGGQLAEALEALEEALEQMFNATEQITFLDNPNSLNGFDNMIYPPLEKQYNKIKVAGEDYYVPWKSIKSGQATDLVDAVMPDEKAFPNNIRFETNTKEAVPTTDVENIKELTVKGDVDGETHQLYPIEERNDSTFLAGKLNVITYDELDLKVTIIPVNGAAYPYDANDLKLTLDSIFGQAVIKPIVTMHPGVSVPEFDNFLNDFSTGTFSNYSDEMNDIIDVFKENNTIDPDGYYVFLLQDSDDEKLLGYMPKTKHFGFVVNNTHPLLDEEYYVNTIAHELGHGAYNWAHTFEQFPNLTQESTDNLMDYANGRHLCKYQWDQARDPGGGLTIFNDDEEGENVAARGYFNRFEFGANIDQTYSFLTPTGEHLILPDTVQDVTVFFGFDDVSTQGEIDKFIHLTPGTLKGFKVGENVYNASIDLNSGNVPVLKGYFNGTEKYDPADYELSSASFRDKAILFGSNRQDYSFYWLNAPGISAYTTTKPLVNVIDFPVQYAGVYVDRKQFAYAQYQQIFGNSQYSLTKENVEWAFHPNWNPDDGTFLLRNKIAELRQAYPTLIDFVTRDYDDWSVCSTTYYRQSNSTFEWYLNGLYCNCSTSTSELNGGTSYECNDKPNVDKPQPSEKLKLFTIYYNWLKDNGMNVVMEGYETLKEWNENPSLIDAVDDENKIFQAINLANVSDFEQLKSTTILKLLSKIANEGLFESSSPNQDGEGALVKLVENVPKSEARAVILGIEGKNLYDQDKWLYIQMFSRANDKFLGFFGENNKQKLVTGFTRLSLLAETLYDERLDDLIENMDERMFILEYQNIIMRSAEQIVMSNWIHKILIDDAFDEYYQDYDIEVEYNKDQGELDGTIDGIQELQQGWFQEEEKFRAENLKPFDLVFFTNKSNLKLIKGFEAENMESKDFPVPAVVLMYADKVATTETVSQVTYTALDIASIAVGVGIPAKVGKLAKAVTYFDVASSITSLGATATSDQSNSQLNSILNTVSGVSGVLTLGLGGATKVKSLFNSAGDVPNLPNPSIVADEILGLTLSERQIVANSDDLFVKLSYYFRKSMQETDDFNKKQKLENALSRLKAARGLDLLSELKTKFTNVNDDALLESVSQLQSAGKLLSNDIPASAPKAFFDDILASKNNPDGLGKNLDKLDKDYYQSWEFLHLNQYTNLTRSNFWLTKFDNWVKNGVPENKLTAIGSELQGGKKYKSSLVDQPETTASLKDGFESGALSYKAWERIYDGTPTLKNNTAKYYLFMKRMSIYADEVDNGGTVKYYRVQGGTGNTTSKPLLIVNEQEGTMQFDDISKALNISTDNKEHAQYYLACCRNGGYIVEFEVPKSLDVEIKKLAIPQANSTTNALNTSGNLPKVVDPNQPGHPFELTAFYHDLIAKQYIEGSVKILP